MATEFVYNEVQLVEANNSVLLYDSIPCKSGQVIHRNGAGVLTLKGKTNQCYAQYQVTFNGNIAVPTGGTVGEISIALALEGEPLQTSRSRVTPAAVEEYFNVTSTAIIKVPKCCCFSLSVRNTSGVPINVQNANLTISRIA